MTRTSKSRPFKDSWHRRAAELAAQGRDADSIVFVLNLEVPFQFYASRGGNIYRKSLLNGRRDERVLAV